MHVHENEECTQMCATDIPEAASFLIQEIQGMETECVCGAEGSSTALRVRGTGLNTALSSRGLHVILVLSPMTSSP